MKEKSSFEEIKEAIQDLNRQEKKVKWEIERKKEELEEIQKTKIKLAYIIGGGNPDDVIKPEDIEDDRNKNNNSRKNRNKRH